MTDNTLGHQGKWATRTARCRSYVIPPELCTLFSTWLAHNSQWSLCLDRGKLVMTVMADPPPPGWPPLAECSTPPWTTQGWQRHPAADIRLPVFVHQQHRLLLEADDDSFKLTVCHTRRGLAAELQEAAEFSQLNRAIGMDPSA